MAEMLLSIFIPISPFFQRSSCAPRLAGPVTCSVGGVRRERDLEGGPLACVEGPRPVDWQRNDLRFKERIMRKRLAARWGAFLLIGLGIAFLVSPLRYVVWG